MAKRKSESGGGNRNKKYKTSGFIDPNTSGIYASCNRGREQGCRKELMSLLTEKVEEWYPDWEKEVEEDEESQELSVEDQIKKELDELKSENKSIKKHVLLPIDLGCECLVFIKVRKPVVPAEFVERLCNEVYESKVKNTRYTQKLTPINFSVSASMEELVKLAEKILKPHFHQEDQKPVKFAIQVTRRNFNTLEKEDIIKTIANCVGREHGHSVDLKKYDKLILVECYKNNIGMSVVEDYLRLEKFNLQQIFEKNMGSSGLSRVAASKADEKEATTEANSNADEEATTKTEAKSNAESAEAETS